MVYVSTEWDYDLKTEVFVIKGDKGYAHTTDTLLVEVGSHNTNLIEYFTATFSVDVLRDIQDSKVVIYDNGEAIPLYVDGAEVQMLNWQQGNQSATFSLKLGYGVEHNIYARYLGNKKGLPSKSKTISLFEPLPNKYGTLIERTTDTSQFDTNQTISIPIRFTTNRTFETSEVKSVDLYVDDVLETSTNISLSAGQTTATGTLTASGLSSGLHRLEVRFDGDEHNEAFNLPFSISVGYKIQLIDHSKIISETRNSIENYNFVTYKLTDYLNALVGNATIKLTDGTTVYNTGTTNSDGIVNFNSITTLPATFHATWEKTNNIIYNSPDISLPVIHVTSDDIEAEDEVIADGYSTNIAVSVNGYNWIHNPQNNLENIPVMFSDGVNAPKKYYTNNRGVVNIPFTGANRGDVVVSAEIGYAVTAYENITDISQYWNTQKRFINKDYRVLAPNFYELNSGFKFEVPSNNALSLIGIGDGEEYDGSWIVSFDVVSASATLRVVAGDWFNSTRETWENLLMSNNVSLKSGQTVTISYTKSNNIGLLKIELPNSNNHTLECYSQGYPLIGITSAINSQVTVTNNAGSTSATAKSQLTIDNVRFRRLG